MKKRIIIALLSLVLLGTALLPPGARAASDLDEFEGINNIIMERPLQRLELPKGNFTVTFQTTVKRAPANAVDLSAAQDRSVLGWVRSSQVIIGGEGGVNAGESCN